MIRSIALVLFLASALSACQQAPAGDALADTPTPAAATQTPVAPATKTPTATPTETSTPVPFSYKDVDMNNRTTWPAELQNYQPGQSIEADTKYHIFSGRFLIQSLAERPEFLAKHGIDINALRLLTNADLENYDTYHNQVFLPYLMMQYDIKEAGGEYTSLPFDQWMVERMYGPDKYIRSCNIDGVITYGFRSDRPLDANSLVEGIAKGKEMLKDDLTTSPQNNFITNINGYPIVSGRVGLSGETKIINAGYMIHPAYPNTRIMISYAFDESSKPVILLPSLVNFDKTTVGNNTLWFSLGSSSINNDWVWLPTRTGFVPTWDNYVKNYETMSWNYDELLGIIGHSLIISAEDSIIIPPNTALDQVSNDINTFWSNLILGVETVAEIVSDQGMAPEFGNLVELAQP